MAGRQTLTKGTRWTPSNLSDPQMNIQVMRQSRIEGSRNSPVLIRLYSNQEDTDRSQGGRRIQFDTYHNKPIRKWSQVALCINLSSTEVLLISKQQKD